MTQVADKISGSPINHMIEPQRGSTMNQSQGILDMICGTPLGFDIFCLFQPSVRYATLGFGVELLCSSLKCEQINGTPH